LELTVCDRGTICTQSLRIGLVVAHAVRRRAIDLPVTPDYLIWQGVIVSNRPVAVNNGVIW